MTVGTYNALLARIRECRTEAALAAFADEVRRAHAGDPQLGDVLNSIRMSRSGRAIAARRRAHVEAEALAGH